MFPVCLRTTIRRSFSTITALESASVYRTVRVSNVPEGYNVNTVVNTLKTNPVQAIIPFKDHMLVQFLDEGMARRCINHSNDTYKLSIDVPSPAVTSRDVSLLGTYNLSRTLVLKNLPADLDEPKLAEILSQREGIDAWRFHPSENSAVAHFLDIHSAFEARTECQKAGMSATFPHSGGDYLFPEWFPEEEDGQAFVETRVEISGIKNFPTLLVVRDWISKFERSSPACLIMTSFYKQRKMLTIQFATKELARKFVEDFSADAPYQNIQLSSRKIQDPLSRGMITAVGLGAQRTVCLKLSNKGPDSRRKEEYFYFFCQFGAVSGSFRDERYHECSKPLFIPFDSLQSALRCVLSVPQFKAAVLDHFPELKGAAITFAGNSHLTPSPVPG
ncbi:hypothetical protein EDD18DRAFT_1186489 [Armillaria luteobubalina]|uniref:RRM domain-containing protein n=1 Tax=Armillaria luteobubalina TaxID=153913 RepID=A0AA39UJE8_9AGAR|nr:hypothetical protein EDD18DRAFT_1186489 [Armillaria luteobubalina]